ncbi:ferredoxin [Nocardia sp. ET3-3]|uniref:Ferredoxin n=1 Tax=Nocardia terrae TaxID=2675851 RepID=A0A7K1V791_9NOCA|nr:ferredoxin [Nocardia terrae]MVU82513.1 ferredoxin [Nocardia terrae]
MSTPQRLHIDWTRCDGRGLCGELLPGQLARDDWGYPLTRDHRDPVIGAADLAAAREAVRLCPRLALRLLPLA